MSPRSDGMFCGGGVRDNDVNGFGVEWTGSQLPVSIKHTHTHLTLREVLSDLLNKNVLNQHNAKLTNPSFCFFFCKKCLKMKHALQIQLYSDSLHIRKCYQRYDSLSDKQTKINFVYRSFFLCHSSQISFAETI